MRLLVNGEQVTMDEPDFRTVADLLEKRGMGNRPCAVEVNRTLITKSQQATSLLREGDVVEIVTLVGGG